MTIGQRIKNRRESMHLTQEYIAKRLGVAIQTIYKYENGIVANIPIDKLEKIAMVLETTPSYLMGWESDTMLPHTDMIKYGLSPIKTKKIPMLGEIACGEPIYANEEYETFIEASSELEADFCLTAKGDSMINARIFDGDIVFIRQQPDVENGEIAAVIIDNDVTLKRVYKYNGRIELRPENPLHRVQDYEGEKLNKIRILGKAIAFQSYVR